MFTAVLFVLLGSGCDSRFSMSHVDTKDVAPALQTNETRATESLQQFDLFEVSAKAKQVLQDAVDSTQTQYARATCSLGGCSGFIYALDTTNDFDEENDSLFDYDGLKVVIDKHSLKRMRGTTLDFLTENGQTGFKFDNPNPPPESEMGKPE